MDYNRFDVPLIDPANQSPKDCKKTTPDFKDGNEKKLIPQVGFKSGNAVKVVGKSLLSFTDNDLDGVYMFDSYDKYDNTCYVQNKTGMNFNVLLTQIQFLNKDMKSHW